MAWLENIAGGFTILVLASLIFLVIGFLLHSTGTRPEEEPAPPSALKEGLTGLFFLVAGGVWAFILANEWSRAAGDTFTLVTSTLWTGLALLWAVQHLRAAMRAR